MYLSWIALKAKDRRGLGSSCRRQDLSGPSGHLVCVISVKRVAIPEQIYPLISRLTVIEGLIMRKGRGGNENVNGSGHIFMDQADQLEISSIGENDGEHISRHERGSGYAGRAIERGRVCRKAGTPISEEGAWLIGC